MTLEMSVKVGRNARVCSVPWLGRGLSRLPTVPLTDGTCALAERELTRLPVLFKAGRLARLCGLDLVQQAAISRKPLINSLGTGNCPFDQNIFFSLGFSRKDTWKLLCHNYGRPRNWAVDQKHFPFFFLTKKKTATQHHPGSGTLSLRGQKQAAQRKSFSSRHN